MALRNLALEKDSRGRPKSESCREKMRRDRLNDKLMELGAILEPGKTPKLDKGTILSDAAKRVTQLRAEAEKLKELNRCLQEKIEELKVSTLLFIHHFMSIPFN